MNWSRLLSDKRTRELLGGRASKKPVADTRTEFERDYGRAVFSTPVRRLQDKTQVFPLEAHDSVRTRLTHSVEVSSIAGDLTLRALRAAREAGKPIPEAAARQGSTIAATVGLVHDIGNPPFGHAGEDAMREWFDAVLDEDTEVGRTLIGGLGGRTSQHAQDFLRFEGNAQTLRLLSRLQVLSDRYGLNLTAATFSAACKYVAPSDHYEPKGGRHDRSKPGFFVSETEVVEAVRQETGTGEARHPIAFLAEAADDTVYSVADLEDGVKKKILSWKTLEEELIGELEGHPAQRTVAEGLCKGAKAYVEDADLGKGSPEWGAAVAQMFRTYLIGHHVAAASAQFVRSYDDVLDGSYHGELVEDGDTGMILAACKKIGGRHVYPSVGILKLETYGRRVLHDLMDVVWEGASQAPEPPGKSFASKIYGLLSENYKSVLRDELGRGDLPETYIRLQLVADYVGGMTDTFAIQLHRELFGR